LFDPPRRSRSIRNPGGVPQSHAVERCVHLLDCVGVRFSDGTVRATTSPPEAEDFRIGDYTVTEPLGTEEAGEFHLGEHVVLPRKAAIKLLSLAGGYNKSAAVAMLREACLVEALVHPGIPRIYECGVLPDKRPWTAYELVEGASVATRIAIAPMALADVVVLVRDVADVLDHIHKRGIVHRQISTESIVFTPFRRYPLVVRHWGDACTLDSAGIAADPRDDVYELGRVAFLSLTGRRHDGYESCSSADPHAPRDVTALIDHMLDQNVTKRPTSADVHERGRWLAEMVEQIPARPATRDLVPPDVEEVAPGLMLRIAGRTRTR
jgi:serine/threonine protein kinase